MVSLYSVDVELFNQPTDNPYRLIFEAFDPIQPVGVGVLQPYPYFTKKVGEYE